MNRHKKPARRGRRRLPAWSRLLGAVVLVLGLGFAGALALAPNNVASPPPPQVREAAGLRSLGGNAGEAAPGADPSRSTLVLYDGGGDDWQAESDAVQTAHLASHGGRWEMRPAREYRSGDLKRFTAAIYVGTVEGAQIPRALLSDVADRARPVLWMGANIGQLFTAEPAATAAYGWRPRGVDWSTTMTVDYSGQRLRRETSGDVRLTVIDAPSGERAEILAMARPQNGPSFPWAVRSDTFTYIGEVPFAYVDVGNRYLAAADIIARLVRPTPPPSRRALLRLEDVGPNTDPQQLRDIADFLSSRRVPFSIATYGYYRDPLGRANDGRPTEHRLVDKPDLVAALKYAIDRGGTLVMHGYSHQYGDVSNPYSGTSADDFEFYLASVDEKDNVRLSGPVPEDSPAWAADRVASGRGEFRRAGLPEPEIFEFPHYAGSAASYEAVQDAFGVRYDQGTYFAGMCSQGRCDDPRPDASHLYQQAFPFVVRDVYGSVVVPENLGNVAPGEYNNHSARSAADIVNAARSMSVVRDGIASTFYHPFLGVERLNQVVTGIQELGYTFVSARDVLPDSS